MMETPLLPKKILEEDFREAACEGDRDRVRNLLQKGVQIDSQNSMNGWTALHWACKRGHVSIVKLLLAAGATSNLPSSKGDLPFELTDNKEIREMLGGDLSAPAKKDNLSITPHYLNHPKFPYISDDRSDFSMDGDLSSASSHRKQDMNRYRHLNGYREEEELVLKVRVAHAADTDFIEIELDHSNLTYENLVSVMCRELEVDRQIVHKIRKLPDTIVRKDKDVKRLKDFQELELVLTTKAISASSRTYGPSPTNSVAPTKDVKTIVY